MVGASRPRRLAAGCGVAALAVLAGCWVDEGTPPGTSSAVAGGVTADGTVVVHASGDGGEDGRAYVLEPDGDWVAVPGGEGTTGLAIADDGTIVGSRGFEVVIGSVDTPLHPLSDVSGVHHDGVPRDIADSGVVVGDEIVPDGAGGFALRGWLWDPRSGRDVVLPGLAPTDESSVVAVEAAGMAVGWSRPRGSSPEEVAPTPVVWAPPAYAPVALVGPPVGVAAPVVVSDIGDGGEVVGRVTVGGASRAVLWPAPDAPGVLLDERTDPATSSAAQFVDDDGTVVGRRDGRATVWDATTRAPARLRAPVGGEDVVTGIDGGHVVGVVPAPDGAGRHVLRYGRPG